MTYWRGMADRDVAAKLGVAVAMFDGRRREGEACTRPGTLFAKHRRTWRSIAVILLAWFNAASPPGLSGLSLPIATFDPPETPAVMPSVGIGGPAGLTTDKTTPSAHREALFLLLTAYATRY
jgi:hypothetical protein